MALDIDLFGEHWVTRRPLNVAHGRGGLCRCLPAAAMPPSDGAGRPRTVLHAVLGFARRGMSSTLVFPVSIQASRRARCATDTWTTLDPPCPTARAQPSQK